MFDVNEDVLNDIKKSFIIPSKPALLDALKQQLNSKDPDIGKVAMVISQDIGVAGAVLKVINSPAYGLARTVTDIKQSVMFLGLAGVNSLVTGLVLRQSFGKHKSSIPLDGFWEKASSVAKVAIFIAKRYKAQLCIEDIYTAALFQDCGIPAMAVKYGDYDQILDQADHDTEHTVTELEELRYPTNHAVVGYFIASTWHLPPNICQLVLRHHEREYLDNFSDHASQLMFAVIKMAENIVHNLYRFRELPDWETLKEPIFDIMGCDDDEYNDIYEDVEQNVM
ncbi:MAG: HD-like signal output (HDOD) protein [Phenylobacterium sp.]|jgi:HD-like signal output (HDOD) protein